MFIAETSGLLRTVVGSSQCMAYRGRGFRFSCVTRFLGNKLLGQLVRHKNNNDKTHFNINIKLSNLKLIEIILL